MSGALGQAFLRHQGGAPGGATAHLQAGVVELCGLQGVVAHVHRPVARVDCAGHSTHVSRQQR